MAQAKEKLLFSAPADIEDDFYQWCFEQAEILRQRRFGEADLPNIIEELESMGKSQRAALKPSYRVLLVHLLKWQHQPERRARSRDMTIIRERNDIPEREEDNKILRSEAPRIVDEVFRRACRQAAKKTALPVGVFPADCPCTVDQLRDPDWMPE